jgi:hypothetical protein
MLIKVELEGGKTVLLNDSQVCSVVAYSPDNIGCIVRMSNGDEYLVLKPTYKQWENDTFV